MYCLQENPRHDSIAIKICNEVLSNPDSFNLKLWVKILNKLELSESNDEAFKELAVLADQMLEVKIDGTFALFQQEIYNYKIEKINAWNRKNLWKLNFLWTSWVPQPSSANSHPQQILQQSLLCFNK